MILTKNKGISEGVTNIFIENMNKLSLYERPLHCTDAKRDIVYIKSDKSDDNSKAEWYKDDENIKLKEAIKKITHALALFSQSGCSQKSIQIGKTMLKNRRNI